MCPQHNNEMFRNRSSRSEQRLSTLLSGRGEEAARIGRRLVELERERSGLNGAFYALERRTGIGHRTWRDWWYWQSKAPCQGVLLSTWNALINAYEIECANQLHKFERELEHAKTLRRGDYRGGTGKIADQVD